MNRVRCVPCILALSTDIAEETVLVAIDWNTVAWGMVAWGMVAWVTVAWGALSTVACTIIPG